MGKRVSDRELDELYGLLSVEMMALDCGTLCAPANGGMPLCCDNDRAMPALYKDEYRLQGKRGRYWRRMRCRTAEERELKASIESEGYAIAATCPGPQSCDRSRRALVCRTYPLEPHLDTKGNLLGLTFTADPNHTCPLIGDPGVRFNETYLRNAIAVWRRLLELYPEERELFRDESRRLRRRLKRRGKRPVLFGATGNEPQSGTD